MYIHTTEHTPRLLCSQCCDNDTPQWLLKLSCASESPVNVRNADLIQEVRGHGALRPCILTSSRVWGDQTPRSKWSSVARNFVVTGFITKVSQMQLSMIDWIDLFY